MTDMDFNNYSIYALISMATKDVGLAYKIDKYFDSKIISIKEIAEVVYWISSFKIKHFPITKSKVNTLLQKDIATSEVFKSFDRLYTWFDDNTKSLILNNWIASDNVDVNIWMTDKPKENVKLDLLKKLLAVYKKKRSKKNLMYIQGLFESVDVSNLDDACDMIASSSSAVISTLLARDDIEDKYTILGLKNLSSLSRQRKININIKLEALNDLGPKTRLHLMKQLFGMHSEYYKFEQLRKEHPHRYYSIRFINRIRNRSVEITSLPFKTIPSREEIERFLFPCVTEYNEDVVNILKKFDELVLKEKINGKSV